MKTRYLFCTLLWQEDLAEVLGEAAMSLASRRLHRCSFLLEGWPLRLVGINGRDTLAASTLEAFQRDFEAFQHMEAAPAKTPAMLALLGRSAFRDTSTVQFCKVIPGIANTTGTES